MNKKRLTLKRVVPLIILILILFITLSPTLADVGNHTDYSETYSSNSNSSSKNDDSFFLLYIITSLIRTFGITGAIIIGIIGFVIYKVLMKNGILNNIRETIQQSNNVGTQLFNQEIKPDRTREIENEIKKNDELFSVNKFTTWSKEVFITIQEAWEERDWTKIRPFEKEEIYKLHELQLKELIDKGRINKLDEININKAYLTDYSKDSEYEYLIVCMEVRMLDYIINENTGEVLRGNKNIPVRNKYLLTFSRRIGILTNPATSNMSTTRCPNCGAPIQVTSAGKCEYCDFIITTGDHDWVLSNLDSFN